MPSGTLRSAGQRAESDGKCAELMVRTLDSGPWAATRTARTSPGRDSSDFWASVFLIHKIKGLHLATSKSQSISKILWLFKSHKQYFQTFSEGYRQGEEGRRQFQAGYYGLNGFFLFCFSWLFSFLLFLSLLHHQSCLLPTSLHFS